MLASLASVPAAKVPFDALTEFKNCALEALNSYVHAGIHDLLPLDRTTVKLVKSVTPSEDGHAQESIHRRADHRIS